MNTNNQENIRCVLALHNDETYCRPQKKLKPASTFDTVSMLTAIGISNFQLGKHDTAETYFSQALSRFDLKSTGGAAKLDYTNRDVMMFMERISNCDMKSPIQIDKKSIVLHEYDEGVHVFDEPLPIVEVSNTESITSTLFYNIAQTYVRRGQYEAAKTWFQRSLQKSSKANDYVSVFKTLHNLGYCSYRGGDNAEALRFYQKTVEMAPACGESLTNLAASLNCVAVLYFHEPIGKAELALTMFQQSLEIYRSSEDEQQKEIATVLNNTGRVRYLRAEYKQARDLYFEALQLRRNILGEESMDVAATYYNTGQTYHQLGELDTAMEHYNKFLHIAKSCLGPKTREVAIVYRCMAEIHRERSNMELALEAYEKSLHSARTSLGDGHPEVASILNKAGNLCYEMGAFCDALKYYMEGLEIERNHLTPNHPRVIVTFRNIAHVHKHRGDYSKALFIYRHVYFMQVQVFGSDSIGVADTLSSIGLMQYHLKEFESAFESYQEALRVRRDYYGKDDHPDIASTLNSLGLVLFKQDMFEMAKECFFESLRVRRKVLGANHHDVAILWYNIATIYYETGEDDKAIAFYKESLRVERQSLGETHPDVVLTLQHIGKVLQQLGRLDEAVEYFQDALRIERKRYDRNLTSEAEILNQLGNAYLQQGDVGHMMEAFIESSRILKSNQQSDENLIITDGYNHYGLSKTHPPCASVA